MACSHIWKDMFEYLAQNYWEVVAYRKKDRVLDAADLLGLM